MLYNKEEPSHKLSKGFSPESILLCESEKLGNKKIPNWLFTMLSEIKEDMASGTDMRKNKFSEICDKEIMAELLKKQNGYCRKVSVQYRVSMQ